MIDYDQALAPGGDLLQVMLSNDEFLDCPSCGRSLYRWAIVLHIDQHAHQGVLRPPLWRF